VHPRVLLAVAGLVSAVLLAVFLIGGGRQAALTKWARQNAIPLRSSNPKDPIDDLSWLHRIAHESRVIGLGEATHGTREFFQMKHRLLRYLVENEGFTIFAIEANLPEAETLNAYVVNGQGDPANGLAGLHFWTWDTYEVLDLIEWMRAWNADVRHPRVTFYGFDCQFSGFAAREVKRYLDRVAPTVATKFKDTLDVLSQDPPPGVAFGRASRIVDGHGHEVPHVRTPESDRLLSQLDELGAIIDLSRSTWNRSGESVWALMRRYVEVLRQATVLRGGQNERDRFMAENVRWILTREGGKAVLWAHNAHVSRERLWMGRYLDDFLGEKYKSVGFEFGEGRFRAHPTAQSRSVNEVAVSFRNGGDFDQSLAKVSLPLFALEMRDAPMYLRWPMSVRESGAFFSPGIAWRRRFATDFDVIIFVRETSAARPTPTGIRTRG
jgi:erythromycin esterase